MKYTTITNGNYTSTREAMLDEAAEYSKTLTIRTYVDYYGNPAEDGNSVDTKRKATKAEQRTLYAVFAGTISNIMFHYSSLQSDPEKLASMISVSINNAEFTADALMPQLNGYDSIYIPLHNIVNNHLSKQA